MRGYESTSYGDGFADVYDDWYSEVTDVEATVLRVLELAGPGGRVLELGVGTGRLAIPMATAGLRVVGIDSSEAMLAKLTERLDAPNAVKAGDAPDPSGTADPPVAVGPSVTVVRGDMVDDLPDGPFDVCLVAYNTIFNVLDADAQGRCFAEVAARLAPGGAFVVEAIVPDDGAPTGHDISVRSMSVDCVVLSVSDHRPDEQRTSGQFVEFTESGGVRLRPWSIRWATPEQLDDMAAAAGLRVERRDADMAGAAFDDLADHHVTVYRVAPADDGVATTG